LLIDQREERLQRIVPALRSFTDLQLTVVEKMIVAFDPNNK
jgi:hypothetical protein